MTRLTNRLVSIIIPIFKQNLKTDIDFFVIIANRTSKIFLSSWRKKFNWDTPRTFYLINKLIHFSVCFAKQQIAKAIYWL